MEARIFKEQQGYAKWLFWVMGLSGLAALIGIGFSILDGNPLNENTWGTASLVIGIMLVVTYLMANSRLYLEIRDHAIWYRFAPFQASLKKIHKEDVLAWEVKKINPLMRRGYGYRIGFGKRTIIMRGNWALFLERKKGPKLYLGTQRPEEIKAVMEKLFKGEEEY